MHILLVVALLGTPTAQDLVATLEQSKNEKNTPTLLLVELPPQPHPENEPVESFIISDAARKGSGSIKKSDDKRTHLLGTWTAIENHPTREGFSPPPKPASPATKPIFLLSLPDPQTTQKIPPPSHHPPPQQKSHAKQASPHTQPPSSQLGIESENTTNFRFHIDNEALRQPNIAKDLRAKFFLDIKRALTINLQTYANNAEGPGAINYYYLKTGESSALVTIDRNGNMRHKQLLKNSETQPYLNYLIAKVTTRDNSIHHLPVPFIESNDEYLYLKISLSYKGPPLYQWWISLDVLEN